MAMPSLFFQSIGVKLIPDPTHGQDERRSGIVALNALTQPSDVDIHRAGLDIHVVAPDQIENLAAAKDAVRVAHKKFQQIELAQSQAHRFAVAVDFVGIEVDPQPTLFIRLVGPLIGRSVRATEDRLDPGDQLTRG